MKQGRFLTTILLFLLSLSLSIMCGCSSDSSGGGENNGGTVDPTLTALEVTAAPEAINPNETTTIEATAYDASGNTISGVGVTFTLDDPSMAAITSTATTDSNGVAQVVLTARETPGDVNVTATSGSVASSEPATVTILGGGISTDVTIAALNVLATPDSINPNESTIIEATAYDNSGNTIAGANVVFTIDDPTLAYIADSTATTDNGGVAQVSLTAREKSGDVEVTATATNAGGDITSDTPAIVTILSGSVPDTINLTVTPVSIIVQGTTSVKAEVLDTTGAPVADGTTVSFVSNNTLYGNFSSPTATTKNGFATATFEAANEQGTAAITVQSGGVSSQSSITIYPAEATSVEYVSAIPQRIPLQGSGGGTFTETSTIQFIVKDSNGNPVEGVAVSFTMNGPNGGEKIDPTPGDPTPQEIEVSSNANGIAQVILTSGSVAGPVTIQASITATDSQGNPITITSQSSVVSIGGGVPSDKRFDVAATVLNLAALNYSGETTEIRAFLADRFGNYNVLVGTTVSYISERGLAIDTSDVTVDEDGTAMAVARTQWPQVSSPLDDVAEESWETALLEYIETVYGVTLPNYSYGKQHHPREGLCSVTVYVKGEEHFWDTNANGYYDSGDTFNSIMDTFDDPFIDVNDDGLRNDGTSDPFEEYIDGGTGDGIWSGKNGVWDADKNIFANFKILLTGEPYLIVADEKNISLENGESMPLTVMIGDINGNPLIAGSSVKISADAGKLLGETDFVFPDTNVPGPIELGILIADASPDQEKLEPINVTVTVNWKALEYSVIVAAGTIK